MKNLSCKNIRLLTLAVMTITLLASDCALSQQPRTEHAEGSGCVRPGKKKGCFVVHDLKQRAYWDLTFPRDNRPELYTHISFEGIGYQYDAQCSEGRPVHVSSWKILPGECSRPAPSEPKSPAPSQPQ